MVLVNDAALAAKARGVRNLCFVPSRRFLHKELGFNFRLTNVQAAIGVARPVKLRFGRPGTDTDRTIHATYQTNTQGNGSTSKDSSTKTRVRPTNSRIPKSIDNAPLS